jgi:hypothetical protein
MSIGLDSLGPLFLRLQAPACEFRVSVKSCKNEIRQQWINRFSRRLFEWTGGLGLEPVAHTRMSK